MFILVMLVWDKSAVASVWKPRPLNHRVLGLEGICDPFYCLSAVVCSLNIVRYVTACPWETHIGPSRWEGIHAVATCTQTCMRPELDVSCDRICKLSCVPWILQGYGSWRQTDSAISPWNAGVLALWQWVKPCFKVPGLQFLPSPSVPALVCRCYILLMRWPTSRINPPSDPCLCVCVTARSEMPQHHSSLFSFQDKYGLYLRLYQLSP